MKTRTLAGALALLSLLMHALIAGAAPSDHDATLFRVFLKDGASLVSYGEIARVGDRVIFSMPTGAGSPPPLHLTNVAADRVDWPRTDRYARYTATVGVLTMDNTLVQRAVVQNEFRKVTDFVDRIGGGAGPAGIKAVGPTGTESISMLIPEEENEVSILGEKLTVERLDGTATYSSPGRPIISIIASPTSASS